MPNDDNAAKAAKAQAILDRLFSSAALLGDALFYFGREILGVSFDGYEEAEAEAVVKDQEWLSSFGDLLSPIVSSRKDPVPESESPGDQTIQVMTFLRPEVRELFSSSALYEIFSESLKLLGREGSSLDQMIDGLDLVTLSGCWIISKRVFILGHGNDCINMVEALLAKARGVAVAPLHLSAATAADQESMNTFFEAYFPNIPAPSSNPVEKKEAPKPEAPSSITTFISTDKIYLPVSKAFRLQGDLASVGLVVDEDGVPGSKVNVGSLSRPVWLRASITAKDGKSPIKLSAFEMNIEATIGQMFQMNGYKSFKCTPAQIYRIYAGMDTEDTVHPDQIEKVVKAMDKLIQTPATLDFAEQIEKHTRMKKRDNFDYTDTSRVGNLITGVHDQKKTHTYNGITVTHTFTIHEMPMFYAYSYAVGQIYTVSKYLLTGDTPPAQEVQKKAKAKPKSDNTRRLRSDDIDLRRYLLGYIEFQKSEKEKRDKKLKAYNKPIPDFFEFYLPFETVADAIKCDKSSAKTMRKIREQTYAFMTDQAKAPSSAVTFADYYKSGKALHGVRVRI